MEIVNTDTFNELMNKKGVTVVDFFATWCGPCKMLSPVMEKVAGNLKDKASFVKVDIDQSPELAQKFGIMAVPTVIIFKDGQQANAFTGYQGEKQVQAAIEKVL